MTNLHKLAEFLAELDYHEKILEQLPLILLGMQRKGYYLI